MKIQTDKLGNKSVHDKNGGKLTEKIVNISEKHAFFLEPLD